MSPLDTRNLPRMGPEAFAALAASAFFAVAILGPWATGIHAQDPPMGPETTHPRTVVGVGSGGLLLSLAAIAAGIVLLLPLTLRARHALSAGFLLLALAGCASVLANGGAALGFHLGIFEEWRELRLGWGILLATVLACVGVSANVLGFLRHRSARPEGRSA